MKGRLAWRSSRWTADPLAGFFDDLLKDNLPSGDKDFLEGMKHRCEIMAKASIEASKMAQQLRNKADYYDEQEKMGAL